MTTLKTLAFALVAFSTLLVASPAVAQDAAACSTTGTPAQFSSLRGVTESLAVQGQSAEKDRANLVGKVDNAAAAFNKKKYCDAIAKLDDYLVKVNALAGAGRISEADRSAIVAAAGNLINCIQTFQTSNGGAACPTTTL